MSYSLVTQCYNCLKKGECTDRQDIQDAINVIHTKSYDQGHRGSGTIVMSCIKCDGEYK